MSKKSNNSLFVRIFSAMLVCVMLFSALSTGAYAAESTTRDFQAEIDAIQAQIDSANNSKSDQQKTASELQSDIATLQEQIDVYNAKIDELNTQIAEKDAIIDQYEEEIAQIDVSIDETNVKIDGLNAKIADTYEVLKQRLRASYMAGETSTLEILLGASDFESFLTRLELLSVVAKKDDALVSGLEDDIKEQNDLIASLSTQRAEQEEKRATVDAERSAIVASRTEVQSTRNTLETKQTSIEKKVQTVNSIISNLDSSTAEYRAQMAIIEKAQAEYDANKMGGMNSGSGSISGGGGVSSIGSYTVSSKGMIWPLQYKGAYINSPYNPNRILNGKLSAHYGLDMICASVYGKEIRAAADGVVYSAEYHYSWGNNVYINHGNGVYTRYAHCSKMIVSAGESVKQGQVIAYVGDTGNVTGPHLHFEVYVNKVRVDPAPWIPSGPD